MATLPNTGIEVPDVGSDSDQWGGILNAALSSFDSFMVDVGGAKVQRLANGGTGAADAAGARTNLGLKAMALADDVGASAVAYVRKNNAWAAMAWDDIAGKPVTFPPDYHTHSTSEITGLDTALTAIDVAINALEDADVAMTAAMKTVVSATYTAAHTLVAGDAGKILYYNSASGGTFTIPDDTVVIPVDTRIDLSQLGAGQLTIAPGAGVTLNSFDSLRKLAGPYAGATLHNRAANNWVLFGNLA
jgi:hypothetical protein